MASTYSSLKIELIGTGEQAGTWGSTTNTNLGTALEQAITGTVTLTFASADLTLTLTDTNAAQNARALRLNLGGTTAGARSLIVPAIAKQYIVNNGTADTITVKNATGTGVAIPTGMTLTVFNNATDVVVANNYAPTFTAGTINKVTITAPASSSTLTIANGKTLTANSTLTLAGTDSKTLTVSNSLTLAGTDSTTMTFPPASASVGYLNVPVNSQSAAYTAVLADSGKVIFHPSTDANARTFTIPANGSVAYDVGTVLTFLNMTSQVVTIAITTDTMYLAGTGSTGSRSLAQYGLATAIKMTSTTWLISGTGVT